MSDDHRLWLLAAIATLTQVAACRGSEGAPPKAPESPAPPGWSYSGDEGPLRWGDLDARYSLCKVGTAQSPVDLPVAPARREPAPARPHWEPMPLRVTNNGHAIQIDDTASSSFVVDGASYHLVQFHFHSPSEHALGGRTFAVEMHLVHKSGAGKLLVVALFFETGIPNAVLAPVWSAMPAQAGATNVGEPGTTIDVSSLLPSEPHYLRYEGSLTTPPCTEGVTWLVVEPDKSLQMSEEQVRTLRDRTQPSTHRPLQEMRGRNVIELVP